MHKLLSELNSLLPTANFHFFGIHGWRCNQCANNHFELNIKTIYRHINIISTCSLRSHKIVSIRFWSDPLSLTVSSKKTPTASSSAVLLSFVRYTSESPIIKSCISLTSSSSTEWTFFSLSLTRELDAPLVYITRLFKWGMRFAKWTFFLQNQFWDFKISNLLVMRRYGRYEGSVRFLFFFQPIFFVFWSLTLNEREASIGTI